jgi:DMSO/TMAO reductase YedYZ molybdopterin-dependent catalytic subunit
MTVSKAVPAVDPEEACQQAIEAGLLVRRAHPLCCETSIPALVGGSVTPNAHFYIRNHFQIPKLDPASYRLAVNGLVERPLSRSLRDLPAMTSKSLIVTLECAGNGRTLFKPAIEGEQWELGAVSTAKWTGVPLVEVLERAGVLAGAQEVLFRGADFGKVEGSREIRFERSLRLEDAREEDVLLAYAMNGETLPIQHGYPLRLIVPRWYAFASVKWLTEIEVIAQPFAGYYQGDKYWYECPREGQLVREPVTLLQVRALITDPATDTEVRAETLTIRGVAWSGAAPIARVEVIVGDGGWQQAQLIGEHNRFCWQAWELNTRVQKSKHLTLRARATDLAGRTQPERAEWNRLGYGNNAIHEVHIKVS